MPTSDHLETSNPITSHDYLYLKGDEEYWPRYGSFGRGAAFNVVAEWCMNRGYGGFGMPTEAGRTAMNRFEFFNAG